MTRKWWTLALVCVAAFMLLLAITIVNVALPEIQSDLGASLSSLQWVVDAYALTLAAFLLAASPIGGRVGRTRVFSAGCRGSPPSPRSFAGSPTDPTLLNLTRRI